MRYSKKIIFTKTPSRSVILYNRYLLNLGPLMYTHYLTHLFILKLTVLNM